MRSEEKMQRETPNFCETDEGGEEFSQNCDTI